MDVSTILNNGLFQKIYNTPYGWHWKSCTNSCSPSKFSETNDSGGGGGGAQSFLSKMKFSHKSHN